MVAVRRLAAVLIADVVGYSLLMETNEVETLEAVQSRHREILTPLVSQHSGRIVKFLGDGALIEFPSAVSAVSCASDIQAGMEASNKATPDRPQIVFRIGINLGDIIADDGDIYGDGVNIAARLESLAEPGDIYVSSAVFDQVRSKLKVQFEDLGERVLKNITEPVRIYRIGNAAGIFQGAGRAGLQAKGKPPQAIVVLPFVNMSPDPEQTFFSDGITEDIITDLSKIASLKVLSRNTSFTFKDRAVDARSVARQLGVGLILEGSVRKSGGRVRIAAQLIDAANDDHIWAQRYDRDLNDIFALQDEISQEIVLALRGRLLPEEKHAIERRPTYNPQAYELYLLARHYLTQRGGRNVEIALRFAKEAIDSDAQYARAWALVALCHSYLYLSGRSEDSGLGAAERALRIDAELAEAHSARGRILASVGQFDAALQAHQVSLELDPESFDVEHNFGLTCMEVGDYLGAIRHMERAAALFESDHTSLNVVALCYRSLGMKNQFKSVSERAITRIEKELEIRPENANALLHGALVLARIGRREQAADWLARAQIIEPNDAMGQYNAACTRAQLGDPPGAMALLNQCLPRMPQRFLVWVKLDPDLSPLHADPAFDHLVRNAAQSRQA